MITKRIIARVEVQACFMSFLAERAKHFGFVDLIFLPRRISTDELLKWFALQDASVATDASFQNMSMPAECFQGLITKQNWRHRWSALRWEKAKRAGNKQVIQVSVYNWRYKAKRRTLIRSCLLIVFRQRFKSGYGSHYFHVNLTIALILPC